MYQIDFNHPANVYFIGIGGISMSGFAQLLHDYGFRYMAQMPTKARSRIICSHLVSI